MNRPFLTLTALALMQTGCSDECLVTVHNEISESPPVTLTSFQVRLEGTSYWSDVNLLDNPVPPGKKRQARIQASFPYALDLRASDSTRSWSRETALICDAPADFMQFSWTDADRDIPCTWTVTNETGGSLTSLMLRRAGAAVWVRELLSDSQLSDGESLDVQMDDASWSWDLRGSTPAPELETFTLLDLGACRDGEPKLVIVSDDDSDGSKR